MKIKLNQKEVSRQLLKGEKIMSFIQNIAQNKLDSLGEGYALDTYPNGKYRSNVSLYAKTKKAKRDNYKNNSLLKAIKR